MLPPRPRPPPSRPAGGFATPELVRSIVHEAVDGLRQELRAEVTASLEAKASKQSVATALKTKANREEVETLLSTHAEKLHTALAGKASNEAMTSALAAKASRQELETVTRDGRAGERGRAAAGARELAQLGASARRSTAA